MVKLHSFNDIEYYRAHFMDLEVWKPYVEQVCRRHFGEPEAVRAGLAGTCPTFIVDDRYVVKFFGRLFEGGASYETEREAARITAKAPIIPTAQLEAEGELLPDDPDWNWPYLVYEYLPGVSFGEVYDQLSESSRLEAAKQMGRIVKAIHGLPLTGRRPFSSTWNDYTQFLSIQAKDAEGHHKEWGSLPEKLIGQIEGYLLPVEELIDYSAAPHLIHADLTADHLLGIAAGGRWSSAGLIDWGDAMVGNILYELVALHLDLFRGDGKMLAAFMETYNLPPFFQRNFVRKVMSVTLLHHFDVLVNWGKKIQTASLDELASKLWEFKSFNRKPGMQDE